MGKTDVKQVAVKVDGSVDWTVFWLTAVLADWMAENWDYS
jgi:hypothetical protein